MKWYWFICLSVAAWEDARTRRLPDWLSLAAIIPGIFHLFLTDPMDHLMAAAVGTVLLLLSYLTEGAVGEGDGLFFLITACYLNLTETAMLFLAGLGISCIWSIGILAARGWFRERSGRDSVPFLTCVWLPGAWMMWQMIK